jgi:hypothetical protein
MRSSGLIELDAVLAVARHRGFRWGTPQNQASRRSLEARLASWKSWS